MRAQFLLFNTPIDLAHHLWENAIEENDLVIDATCGNGKDSLFLAKLLEKKKGLLYCIDIQESAILNTQSLLQQEIPSFFPTIHFFTQSHECLPLPPPNFHLKLIVFNLGYLPGGDKSITTKVPSTLKSIESALNFLEPGGVLSITCYPGHPEGKEEEKALSETLSQLSPLLWSFSIFTWPNRNRSPSLFLVQRSQKKR